MQYANIKEPVQEKKPSVDGGNQYMALEFSVVIPLYNKVESIVATLDSVLAQTYAASQVVVVDDGSDDGGADLVADTFGDAVTLLRQSNAGVSSARNTGVAHATGEYIAFLDADDFWAPHFLEELVLLYVGHPEVGMLASAYQYLDGPACYTTPKIRGLKRSLFNGCLLDYFQVAANGDLPFNASSVAIRLDLITRIGGFPEGEPMGEDQCVWSRVALTSTIAYSPRSLSFYNRSISNRACQAAPPSEECAFSRRLMTYVNNVDMPKRQRDHIIDYTAAHLIQLADRNISANNLKAAFELLKDRRCSRKSLKRIRSWFRLALGAVFSGYQMTISRR